MTTRLSTFAAPLSPAERSAIWDWNPSFGAAQPYDQHVRDQLKANDALVLNLLQSAYIERSYWIGVLADPFSTWEERELAEANLADLEAR